MQITLGEYRKRRIRKSRRQQFRGWVVLHGKAGGDWGVWDKWALVSGPYVGKAEAVEAMAKHQPPDCCPRAVEALYW